MGEIKSVKVDNWGVFFLQKLQNFFNKTDYCDLTLQFKDNSQLKVHRLVLSACTDYFNVLEQTCEVVDDALIMPNELQADVVVPIVNFMYTGTLEFELKMYGKLLRTAKEMNMTVLLKLLEAHRRTMEGVNRSQRPASPKQVRRRNVVAAPTSGTQTRIVPNSPQQPQQQRRILTTANAPQAAQRRLVQTKTIATNVGITQSQLPMQFRQQIGSTSLIKTSPIKNQRTIYETNYEPNVSSSAAYETTVQLKQEQHDEYEQPTLQSSSAVNQSTSPFEQLRKGYNNNKRPASATFISPPAKKPNIEDVKEFAEQQRMRKQIAAEYGDDNEYEGMLDDDIHNDDDDDDTVAGPTSSASAVNVAAPSRPQQHHSGPSIIIKQEPNEKPTIVVKDSANSKMNHAKIISEVLRQYPHLVKSNKNIKLKIMPNVGGQTQKIIVKKEQLDTLTAELGGNTTQSPGATSAIVSTQSHATAAATKQNQKQQSLIKPIEKSNLQQETRTQLPTVQKTTAAMQASLSPSNTAAVVTSSAPAPVAADASNQKRRIDSKTMHALIAQGAENTTGPWLCLRCGVNGRPISIPSYRGFRRHLINTHKETIDPALCEHCGWRSTNNRELHFHTQVEHKVKTTLYTFPECLMCSEIFLDTNALNQHMVDTHPDENQQQCIYCNKIFAKELQLYTHMKTFHKKQAIEDGIIDYSEDEEDEPMETQDEFIDEQGIVEKHALSKLNSSDDDKKIKILSDISLPSASTLMKLEPSSEAAALTTIASGIATSIGLSETEQEYIKTDTGNETATETKFVSADGNEMVLTDEQRKEIMSQLNQEHDGGVVMVLNEPSYTDTVTDANAEDTNTSNGDDAAHKDQTEVESEENVENSAAEDDYDDNNIYSEFVSGASGGATKKDESKGSVDNLEWAENLISAQELEDETESSKKKDESIAENTSRGEDISKKLQELTGDWTDDENDDEDQEIVEKTITEEESPLKSNEIEAMDTSVDHTEIEKPEKEKAETKEEEKVQMEEDNLCAAEKSKVEEGCEKEVADDDEHIEDEDEHIEDDDEHIEDDENVGDDDHIEDDEQAEHNEQGEEDEQPEDDIDIALKGLHKDDINDNDEENSDSVDKETDLKNKESEDQNINESLQEKLIDDSERQDKKADEIKVETTLKEEKITSVVTEVEDKKDKTIASGSISDIDREMKKSLLDEIIHENDETEDEVKHETEEQQKIASEQSENQTDESSENKVTEDDNKNEKDAKTQISISASNESSNKEKSASPTDSTSSLKKSSEEKVKTLISEWGEDDED